MEVSRWIFAKALVLTVFVLVVIYSINVYINEKREANLESRMEATIDTLEEMEALTQLMRMFGENATCVTLKSQLELLDQNIWRLGDKIELYKRLTEEYMTDPYYLKQKRRFNRQEVLYLSLLTQVRDKCDIDQTVILYFYRRGEDCKQCDDQAYVLDHLNKRIDEELAIFSFDSDLNVSSVNVLAEVYGVGEHPCTVIEGNTYCGLRDKDEIERLLCENSPNVSICN
ncbi:MAG: hypothetical protein GF416_06295 [Candidatus Altiarchaeales archaeon]|nr:hypothetical protein [Candidatus Altiarchaeales archaeon]MBD3416726.1 hypothetical protein [Candidatus Altiarchaeales archaeon]